MKKQLITEISRLREMMGLKPQLLMEGGVNKVFIEFLQGWYRGTAKGTRDDVFLYLLKSSDEVATFNSIAKGSWEGTGKGGKRTAKDLSGEWKPNKKVFGDNDSELSAFMRGLDDDLMSPNEAEMLMRIIKHGDMLDEMVDGMMKSNSLVRHFKELFPSGKPNIDIIARELNTGVDDELVLVLQRRLAKELPKIQVTNPLKVPRVKIKGKDIGGFTIPALKVKIPRFIYAFNYKNIAKVLWTRSFWKKTGMWIFGLGLADQISRGVQKWQNTGVYDKSGVNNNPFSPAFYLSKVKEYEELNDQDWLDANMIKPTELAAIISKLKTAGVGSAADFSTDDDDIVSVYANDIKTNFQAAQVANEWLEEEDSDLEKDILASMNFPIQLVGTDWLGKFVTGGVNSILPDWVGEIDWTDTNIKSIYNIIKKYDDYFKDDGTGVREGPSTMGDKELKDFYKQIITYPPKLIHDDTIYCSTRGFKILPGAWTPLVADQPSWQDAKNYIKNMDAEKFNEIHKEGVGDGIDVYIISEDGDCSHIEITEPSAADYKKNVEEYFNVVKEVINDGPEEEDI